MKKLLLWLVMVVVMLAVLLGGAGYAMYAMTGDDKLPTQHPTLGDTELEPIGYDWSVPVLGNVLNRTFEQPSTLTVQKLGEMTEAAPELVLPDWAQRTTPPGFLMREPTIMSAPRSDGSIVSTNSP